MVPPGGLDEKHSTREAQLFFTVLNDLDLNLEPILKVSIVPKIFIQRRCAEE